MNDDEIIRLLIDMEDRFPVETWRIDGVPIWPIVRSTITNDNFHMFERVRAARGVRRRLGAALDIVKGPGRRIRAGRLDHQDDRWRPVDALLFSDGVSTTLVDGKYYERFCDPMKFELERRGYESLIITQGSLYQAPRYSRSIAIQPTLDFLRLRARIASVRGPRQRALHGFEEAARWIQLRYPAVRFRSAKDFERSAIYLRHLAGYFDGILRRTVPKVIFTVCYYGLPSMAALLACHRRGIPTVDIQHGSINDLHQAYAHWKKLPAGGYDTLPRYFWCWNEDAVRTIERWSRSSGGNHAPLHGGNLFRDMWREDSNALVMKFAPGVDALVQRARGRTRVLYTCSAFETEPEVEQLATCIRRTEGQAFWFIRLHPCSKETAASRSEALARLGATSFDVHEASTLPLYALLRIVDVHLTEGSSSADEAAEFGVPTLLMSQSEAPLFRTLITEGWADVLRNVDELPRVIEARIERGRRLRDARRNDGGSVDLRTRLDRIFAVLIESKRASGQVHVA